MLDPLSTRLQVQVRRALTYVSYSAASSKRIQVVCLLRPSVARPTPFVPSTFELPLGRAQSPPSRLPSLKHTSPVREEGVIFHLMLKFHVGEATISPRTRIIIMIANRTMLIGMDILLASSEYRVSSCHTLSQPPSQRALGRHVSTGRGRHYDPTPYGDLSTSIISK